MRNDQMNTRQQFRGGLLVAFQIRDLASKAVALQGRVSQPSIGMDDAPQHNGVPDKGHEAFRRGIRNLAHTNPADPLPILLYRNNHKSFLQVEPPRQSFLGAADVAFVYFDPAVEQVSPRPDHGAAQLVQPGPGRLIALQAQHPLQSQRAGAILLRCHPPHGAEPHRQGSSRVLENRPRRHRSLRAAGRAFPQHASDRPCLAATALRTAKAFRPTQLCQILSTRCFGREACFQFKQVSRIIFHELKHYSLWLPESSRYLSGLFMTASSASNKDSESKYDRDLILSLYRKMI